MIFNNPNKMKPRGRKRKLFVSAMLILRLLFGGLQSASASSNSKKFQDGVNSRTLQRESLMIADLNQEGSAQTEQVLKGTHKALKTRGGSDNTSSPSSGPGKFSPGSKARGAAKKNFTKQQRLKTSNKPTSSKSSGSIFAEAFSVKPNFAARTGRNGDGLFGQFRPQPTPDPQNPGCAGGPRSITVLSGQRNSDSSTNLTAHDGFEAKLTDKSENHLTSKHGHKFGVNDLLPRNPNQKTTKFKQTRTRINNENKAKVREQIKSILSDTKSKVYTDVSIRGIQGRVYHCKDTNRVVGIHTEGEFAGQIMKAQPISERQLELLRELNILD